MHVEGTISATIKHPLRRRGLKAFRKAVARHRNGDAIESDLSPYETIVGKVSDEGRRLGAMTDRQLREVASVLRRRSRRARPTEEQQVQFFALVREVSRRVLGLWPYDVQVLAGAALHDGRLVEMMTGEGKTLAAVFSAALNASSGRGVHVLTFNDYLARRDAAWMGPIYQFIGLTVGVVQEGMTASARRAAYAADVTYATAKEAGFDFLRIHLCRHADEIVHRPLNHAIIDEADSILVDEARVPLVVAGQLVTFGADPQRIASIVKSLRPGEHWDTDEHNRNVFLTDEGLDRVGEELGCGDLHAVDNFSLLTAANQALHAHVLLQRDIDYVVRDNRIELVDEFTGRVVDDRRWPDGLQVALEAKESVPVQPGGQILGSIALQHFLRRYPSLSGMTATAQPAAREIQKFYGLKVVPIPPNRACIRSDLPDLIFADLQAKHAAIVSRIVTEHEGGRPILVGTSSVKESEFLASKLVENSVPCRVLNAKNDEAEAEIIANAGSVGAVTISTNMAGRGTDIKLGGPAEEERAQVVQSGGLLVIGTNRHESKRIDDQLRGRAGRQGDPGTTQFFVSLEDHLMQRFGLLDLIPPKYRPNGQGGPIRHPVIRREMDRLQRIVQGQNYDIRITLWRYSLIVEQQREMIQSRRMGILTGETNLDLCATAAPERYHGLRRLFGDRVLNDVERAITIHHIDVAWQEHLALVEHIREGIHLVGLGGLDPLNEFRKQIGEAFEQLNDRIDRRVVDTFNTVTVTEEGIDLHREGLVGPSSTWTYLINDKFSTALHQLLFGPGNVAFSAGAALAAGPLVFAWALWRRLKAGTN